jgi:tetratricopeptide (TPR) repeat protein
LPDLRARDRWLFIAIVAVALAIRIAYLVDVSDSPYFNHPLLDSYWYDDKAEAVAGGDLLAEGSSFRVPLYTYFLAAVYLVFGHSLIHPLVLQVLIGAFTCGLIFLVARRLAGTLAGAFAGFGFALYRMAIYSDGEILPTTLFIAFAVGAVYLLLNALERGRIRDALLTGLLLGLAYLTRPEALLLAGALAVAVIAVSGKRGFRLVGLVSIVLLMMITAEALRNRAISGHFSAFSPQGAVNLYVGNARYSDGKSPVAPPAVFPYNITADPAEDAMVLGCRQAAREAVGHDLDDAELSRYYIRATLAEIRRDWPRWIGLVVRKKYYFLNAYELSDIKYLPRFIDRYSRVLRLPLVSYAVVMPFGLVGLGLVAVRRNKAGWVIGAAFLGSAATCIAFFVIWRFRLPAIPFLLVLGGLAVREVVTAAGARAWKQLFGLAVALALLSTLSLTSLAGVRKGEHIAAYICNEAGLLAAAGEAERAIGVYEEAVAADPRDAQAYYYMGKAYASLGRMAESKEMMNKAIEVNPNYRPFANLSLGTALARQGELVGARSYFRQAIAADPGLAMAHYNLASVALALGDYEEAGAALARVEDLAGGDPELLLAAAQTFLDMGDAEKCAAIAEAVLREDPRNGRAYFVLGLAFERQGRMSEALARFETAARYLPSAQEIRQKIIELRKGELRR